MLEDRRTVNSPSHSCSRLLQDNSGGISNNLDLCEIWHTPWLADVRMWCAKEWAILMSERRIAQLFGLVLGGLLTCTMVLNALAY